MRLGKYEIRWPTYAVAAFIILLASYLLVSLLSTEFEIKSESGYQDSLIAFALGESLALNTTIIPSPAWWNDTINVSGFAQWASGQGFNSTDGWIFINRTLRSINDPDPNGVTICNVTASTIGAYSCLFNASLDLGTFRINVFAFNTSSISLANTSTLFEVKPVYGESPIGTTPRSVYEQPFLIQEPSGKVRAVIVRVITSRGGSIF